MCVYHCVQLSYTTQHTTVLIIFPLILQTIIIAQMMSTGGEESITSYTFMWVHLLVSDSTIPRITLNILRNWQCIIAYRDLVIFYSQMNAIFGPTLVAGSVQTVALTAVGVVAGRMQWGQLVSVHTSDWYMVQQSTACRVSCHYLPHLEDSTPSVKTTRTLSDHQHVTAHCQYVFHADVCKPWTVTNIMIHTVPSHRTAVSLWPPYVIGGHYIFAL